MKTIIYFFICIAFAIGVMAIIILPFWWLDVDLPIIFPILIFLPIVIFSQYMYDVIFVDIVKKSKSTPEQIKIFNETMELLQPYSINVKK